MNVTFEVWMQAVDAACQRKCGLSIHDLTDQPFRALYDASVSPASVARDAIRGEFA